MIGQRLVVLSFAIVCTAFAGGACAEDTDLHALKQQVEELKNTVRQLQEKVDALEKSEKSEPAAWIPATTAPAPGATAAPASPKAMDTAPAPAPVPDRVAPAGKASVDDKVVVLRNSWRHISAGIRQDDVKETLGPPTRETLINGKVVWYYYYAGLGAGSVFFNADGRVSSSQSPNLGWGF